MDTKTVGNLGEQIAAGHLMRRGYKILARNYFLAADHGPKIAEIDIIAKKAGVFAPWVPFRTSWVPVYTVWVPFGANTATFAPRGPPAWPS